jgi:hypothetical protein
VVFEHEVFSDKHDGVVCSFERQMLIASRSYLAGLGVEIANAP